MPTSMELFVKLDGNQKKKNEVWKLLDFCDSEIYY